MRRFRGTWSDAPITASRNLERLRNFFRFCEDTRWIERNPAKAVKPAKGQALPHLPFESEEFEKLLDACDQFSAKGVHGEGNRARLKAMILLLRHLTKSSDFLTDRLMWAGLTAMLTANHS